MSIRRLPVYLISAWFLLAGGSHATTPEQIVLDFETPYPEGLAAKCHRGFTLRDAGGAAIHSSAPAVPPDPYSSNGTRIVERLSRAAPMTLSHLDGKPFTFHSIDIAELSKAGTPRTIVPVTARFADDSIERIILPLDGLTDGTGPGVDFETLTLPPHWTNLKSVEIDQDRIGIDNLVVTGCPVPDIGLPYPDAPMDRFRVLARIPDSNNRHWRIQGVFGPDLLLSYGTSQHVSYSQFIVDLDSPAPGLVPRGSWSASDVTNPFTMERASIAGTELRHHSPAGITTILVDSANEPDISNFADIYPGRGRVAFVSTYHGGQQRYAVFIASPAGLDPVVLPDTVLPDGGLPYSYPRTVHFTGDSIVLDTTTSVTGDVFVARFGDGPLVMTLSRGDTPPGSSATISDMEEVVRLTDTHVDYVVETNEGWHLVRTDLNGVHSRLAFNRLPRLSNPVNAGVTFKRFEPPFFDAETGLVYATGSTTSAGGTSLGVGECVESGGIQYPLSFPALPLPGIGACAENTISAAASGRCYGIAASMDGATVIYEATPRLAPPGPTVAGPFHLEDGTIRVGAFSMTHGMRYALESTDNAAPGQWNPVRQFECTSPFESILVADQPGGGALFRLREIE